MLKVWLAKDLESAIQIADSNKNWVAIETEYGIESLDEKHRNVALSLNHHGVFQKNFAPAQAYKLKLKARYDNFIISHLDLDVIFGILWTAGWLKMTPLTKILSDLVAEADTNGFHSIKEKLNKLDTKTRDRYLAIGYLVNSWIITDDGKKKKDISREAHKLLLKIKDIILQGATKEQVVKYKLWIKNQKETAKTFLKEVIPICDGDLLLSYRAPFGLTTAYGLENLEGNIIVQYNEQSKSLTLSCIDNHVAKKYFGKNGVIYPLQKFFGNKAGGKTAIGGSPRDQELQPEILDAFINFLKREYFNIPQITQFHEENSDVPNYSTAFQKCRRII